MSKNRKGFDTPVLRREDDHLDRWPFAKEIYNIAIAGPPDWSLRAGIYGEWGTGKTSVLEFIASMAKRENHLVVWFDPWEFSSKPALWRAFVLEVFSTLEETSGAITEAGDTRRKALLEKAASVVKTVGAAVAGGFNAHAGTATEAGLDLVKKHFTFGPEDLKALKSYLGQRRLIVLLDDLDRTAAELVPEILFALKELMDLPGFSFVCAFDPIVVGKVLQQHHAGFGDGLKFLEKIIDYPRWLPPPSIQGLTQLALAERKQHCPFVPEEIVRNAIRSLPPNPRSVRQFLRLLTPLRSQIDRHRQSELRWPIILAANILKIRFPQLAHPLLSNSKFWDTLAITSIGSDKTKNDAKCQELLKTHIVTTAKLSQVVLNEKETEDIFNAMQELCVSQGSTLLFNKDSFFYQLEIAEAPAAVTWLEFDKFFDLWESLQTRETVASWVAEHARAVEQDEFKIRSELLCASFDQYSAYLNRAENVTLGREKPELVRMAGAAFNLIKCLLLEPNHNGKNFNRKDLDSFFETFARIANYSGPTHTKFHRQNELLLHEFIQTWPGDCKLLISILRPFNYHALGHFDRESGRELHKRLSATLLPIFATQVLQEFRSPGVVSRLDDDKLELYSERRLVMDPGGCLWGSLRREIFGLLAEASHDATIQENAFQFLFWCVLRLEADPRDLSLERTMLLSDQDIVTNLWQAATATPLAPFATARLDRVARELKKFKVTVKFPVWWRDLLVESGAEPEEQVSSKVHPSSTASKEDETANGTTTAMNPSSRRKKPQAKRKLQE